MTFQYSLWPASVDDGDGAVDCLSLEAGHGSLIGWTPEFFDGWRPTEAGDTLLAIAAAVYSIDKIATRTASQDAWTRRISLKVVADRNFEPSLFSAPLSFLTGDDWQIERELKSEPQFALSAPPLFSSAEVDVVSLFSGGLDSLCGVIDLLEGNPDSRVGLVAHYEGGQASPR
ncbi:hypothetical protein [Mycetocola sp.]|uniref:hypothetical protein n=1 Tax=Mycetocola sp. TaxID=1871042 RepID=UPI003988A8F8